MRCVSVIRFDTRLCRTCVVRGMVASIELMLLVTDSPRPFGVPQGASFHRLLLHAGKHLKMKIIICLFRTRGTQYISKDATEQPGATK